MINASRNRFTLYGRKYRDQRIADAALMMIMSDARVMLTDIPATISDILGLNVKYPGRSVFHLDEKNERIRKFYFYDWKSRKNGYFPQIDEYMLNGSLYDRKAWKKSKTFYKNIQ